MRFREEQLYMKMKKLKPEDTIIVFDLEATCGKGVGITEIIEIGAVKIQNKKVIGDFDVFIKPNIHPTLTNFCTDLTSITQKEVNDGLDFKNAYIAFYNWATNNGADDFILTSWGKYDRRKLKQDAELNKVDDLFTKKPFFNMKGQYGQANQIKSMGLAKALEREELDFVGKQHRAVCDAYNTALLLLLYYDKIYYN